MSSTLVGFSKTRITEYSEYALGTTVIDGSATFTYVKAAEELADDAAFGLTAAYVTDSAETTTTHTNTTGFTVPANSYFWATGADLAQ